ncbi:hypothetical protein [Flavobacterium faecale]|uniref:glycoside hydrolase family 78 protein n=1 Tax=Flavobacterium faecale TaxID=1355330 RepID=UPI003AAFFDAE
MFSCKTSSTVVTNDLKCEYRENPLGLDNTKPRLSWKLKETNQSRGQQQTAYQIIVASTLGNLNNNRGDLWDSGKVESNQSVNVEYSGNKLSKPIFIEEIKVFGAK